jgi:transcription initiation factor TFIID subunit 13
MAPGDGKAGVKKGGGRGKAGAKKKGDAKKGAEKEEGLNFGDPLLKRGLLSTKPDELKAMMYGHGDVEPGSLRGDTVDLVEEIVVDYCSCLMRKAMEQGALRGSKALITDDILFVLRKDERKFERGKELLAKNEEIKQARKTIEGDEGVPKGL